MRARPTGKERLFGDEEIIVSKTDLKGKLTYANSVFLRVSQYTEDELLGAPHNIVRHPHMPRCIFKLLWQTIQDKREMFAYAVNMARDGDHYWVFAHVTPSFDAQQNIVGFHSNRRKPNPDQVAKIKDLYASLRAEENRHANRKDGMNAAFAKLMAMLKDRGLAYDEFVFSI